MIAIILIVSGLLLPALARGKLSALETSDMSRMSQLGLAAQLYEEDHGHFPASCVDLRQANLVPVNLCSAATDPTVEGFAIQTAQRWRAKTKDWKERLSFVAPLEFSIQRQQFADLIEHQPGAGWLLDIFYRQGYRDHPFLRPNGFKILLFDGSVQVRHSRSWRDLMHREYFAHELFLEHP